MSFLGRWLSDALRLAAALAGAIVLLQAPAFTREYTAALLQVAEDSGRDIEQRKASARQHYGIPVEADDPAFLAALRPHEPSNAETLTLSMERHRILRGAYERITARSPLLQPVTAAVDAAFGDDRGYKAAVLRTLGQTYAVQVNFDLASAIYGLAGLFAGSLLGHFVVTAGGGMRGRIRRRRRDDSTEPHPRLEPQRLEPRPLEPQRLEPWMPHPDGPEDGRPISQARALRRPERSSVDRTSS